MKKEFSVFKCNKLLNKFNVYYYVVFFIVSIFIIPFFPWFAQQAHPFALTTIFEYIQYTIHHFPISSKQDGAFTAAIIAVATILLLSLILLLVKLVITPQKIYYSLFKIPLMTIIEHKNIEYCQFCYLELKLNRFQKFLMQPLFNTLTKKEPRLHFFPLHQIQHPLPINQLGKDQKNKVIHLLKQHYNFHDDCPEIILDKTAIQELQQKQLSTKISPRIAYVLICCIPIGGLGMLLTAKAPFFFLTNYPLVSLFAFIFCLIFIPSFLWIKKDTGTFAFRGALVASFFVTMAVYAFLFPLLHAYYTNSYGEKIDYPATLIEIQNGRQIWESTSPPQKFFINKKHPTYMPDLKLNEEHIFSIKYHWHNYVFADDAFINDKNKAQKKTAK